MDDYRLVMEDVEYAISLIEHRPEQDTVDYKVFDILHEAKELLKEQETVEHACEILRSNGWTETEPICSECDAIHVVRCKDCNKRGTSECYVENASGELAFSWIPPDDWFCADGERTDT